MIDHTKSQNEILKIISGQIDEGCGGAIQREYRSRFTILNTKINYLGEDRFLRKF